MQNKPTLSDIQDIQIEGTTSSFWKKEQDRTVRDLSKKAKFEHTKIKNGPYRISIKKQDFRLVLNVCDAQQEETYSLVLSFSPYKKIISDYFLLIDSYEKVRSEGNLQKLESIDMGRRGLHNEGADRLQERLKDNIVMDHETARGFFTLMCTLWHN